MERTKKPRNRAFTIDGGAVVSNRDRLARLALRGIFGLPLGLAIALPSPASATLTVITGWCTQCAANEIKVNGASPGATITVKDANGKVIGTLSPTAGLAYTFTIPPGTPGPISVESSDADDPIVNLRPLYGTTARTDLTVSSGSTAQFGGDNYALSGSFTTANNNAVYDPLSPNYGDVSGVVLASTFVLDGVGPSGTLEFRFQEDVPYTINFASAWSTFVQPPEIIVPVTLPLAGFVSADGGGTWIPFTGTGSGQVSFSGMHESLALDFSLDTQFGAVSGSVDAAGRSTCVPEPSAWALTLIGFAGVGFASRRKRVSTSKRDLPASCSSI
jgi:hypothetical protein